MSWALITDEWRLKLLALGLAVLMLGAVAFSQNPPTTKTLTVPIHYEVPTNPGLVVINYPTQTTVSYSGLADVISKVTADNLIAVVDVSKAHPGAAVSLSVSVTTIPGVTVQRPPPITAQVDTIVSKTLPVRVIARPATGYSIDPNKTYARCPPKADPCSVTFTGPASWAESLQATVTYPGTVNFNGANESSNYPVGLQNSSGTLELTPCHTVPCPSLDSPTITIHVTGVAGSTSSTVPLVDAPPTHGPPTGYRVTGITISPATVVITGDAAVLGRTRTIVLGAVDLSGSTSDAAFQVTINYPAGVTGSVATATIKYSISRNPNVT